MPESRHPTLRALALPDLRNFLVARFFGVMGRSLFHAALAWHVYEVTQQELWLGVMGAVEFLPVIPAALVGGTLADRRDRRNIVLATRAATLLCAALLALSTWGSHLLALLLAMAFAEHLTEGFEFPAAQALLPQLVPREIFQNAVVVSATVRNAAFAAGPVLAGFAIAEAGPRAAYASAALLLGASLLALLRVRRPGASDTAVRVGMAAVREGLGFLRRRPVIVAAMTLDMLAVIFADPTVLLAVFSEKILAVGPVGYGVLSGSMAAGTFLMSLLLLTSRRGFARPGRMLLGAVGVFGLATAVFGLSRFFPLSVAALLAAGMADQVSQVTRSTLIQLATPDALRGRVSAVNMVFVGASNQLGAAFSGFFAAATSAVFATVAGGLACVATGALVALRIPALRRYRLDAEDASGR
jgi:MFS family permease